MQALTGISEDSTYIFTIDGIPFNNLPYREEAKRRSSTISGTDASNKYVGRYGGDSMQGGSGSSNSDYNERRPSSNSHSFNNNNNGGGRDSFSRANNGGARQFNLQSPNVTASKHADPFAESSTSSGNNGGFAKDPFEKDPFASSSDPFASNSTNTSKSAVNTLFPSATPSVPSADNTFDPFTSSTSAPTAPSTTQQFQPQPPPASASGFGMIPGGAPVPPPLPARKQPERLDNPFVTGLPEPGSVSFGSKSSSAPVPAPTPAPVSQPDLFDSPASTDVNAVPTSADPFVSDASIFGGNSVANQDAGGLMSINFSMPTNVQTANTQQSPQQTLEQLPESPVQEDVKCTVTKGINSLVDLDLGGPTMKKDTERRLSSNQGPSLTSLMGPTSNSTNTAAASLTNSMSNFDPFGNNPAASMIPPQQPTGAMTMQGQQLMQQPNMMGVGVGMGMGNYSNNNTNMMMQSAPPVGAMPMNSTPQMSMMGGAGFTPPPPLATNPNANFRSGSISTMMQPQNIALNLNNNPHQDPNKQKTSLDSLGGW